MTDDAERISLALPCRFQGRLCYLLARMEFSLEDGELMSDPEGRIFRFESAESARRAAALRFPVPEAVEADQQELATLRAGLEAMYAPAVTTYDLDAAANWGRQPGSAPPDPVILLEAWRLLAWAGVAPEPARFDPMGYAGLQMERPSDEEGRARNALIETGMKLDGIAREQERSGSDLRADDSMWSASDAERLAGILTSGIPALAARLTDWKEP